MFDDEFGQFDFDFSGCAIHGTVANCRLDRRSHRLW